MIKFNRWFGVAVVLFGFMASCSLEHKVKSDLSTITPVGKISVTVIPTEFPPLGKVTQETKSETTSTPTSMRPQEATLPIPPEFPIQGIEMHQISNSGGLAQVIESGVTWIRRNGLFWSAVEPVDGQRNWQAVAGLEKELHSAAEAGDEVILIIREAPAWAEAVPGYPCGPILPNKLAAFANFMKDAVDRYSVPPYNVRYWELGNEPDVPSQGFDPHNPYGCWGNPQDEYFGGANYAEMLKQVYPAVKTANPEAQVLVGGLLLDCDPVSPPETSPGSGQVKDCKSARFLEGILENGGGDFFDGVSFHAYDGYLGILGGYSNGNWHSAWNLTGPSLIAKARYLRSLLTKYSHQEKYLVNTEIAILCGRDGSEPGCQTDEYEKTKAYYLVHAYTSAMAEKLLANVWYSITGWRGSGLLDNRLNPLPAFQALKINAEQLKDCAFIDEINQYPGVKGYAFLKDDHTIWVLWSLDGVEHVIQFDRTPDHVSGVFGDELPISNEISISLAPVYLEWGP